MLPSFLLVQSGLYAKLTLDPRTSAAACDPLAYSELHL